MSRSIVFILLSVILFACSPQKETTPEIWFWIFENGTVIEFPNSWELVTDSGFYGVSVNDGYGKLSFTPFGYDHDSWEQGFFEKYADGIELNADDNIRVLRAETVIEALSEQHSGITEFVDYLVLVPNNFVLGVYVPITPDLTRREPIIQQVLQSITALHDELNIFSFHGGQAVMTYSNDWEILDRNSGLGVTMRTDDLYLAVAAQNSEFWLAFPDKVDDGNLTHEDIIYAFSMNKLLEDLDIKHTSRHGHRLATYEDNTIRYLAFQLHNDLWFRIQFSRWDGSALQPEDEAIILQMIDSILLNNRNTYYEPINLALPSE